MIRLGRLVRSPLPAVLALSAALAVVVVTGREPAAADTLAEHASAQPDDGNGEGIGQFLYGRDCASCHGPEGEGSFRGVELTHTGEAGAYYMLVTGRMPIDDPEEAIRRGPSPYTDDQIAALVDLVAGFGDGPGLPDLDLRDADLSRGGTLYRLHCAACHSSTAIGGALAFEEFAPPLRESEPLVVAAATTIGPGAMPSFAPLGFTDDELAAITVYVQELREPSHRGGWPIFWAGRVDEGAFAWGVGIPVVLVFSVWMARRVR